MPRRREEGMPWYWWVLFGALFILLLKSFGVLPDPPEYIEILAGIGASIGVTGSFTLIVSKLIDHERRLTKLNSNMETVKSDVAEIKRMLAK